MLLRLGFLIVNVSYINFSLVVTARRDLSFIQVRHTYREYGAVVAETECSHAGVISMELAQTFLVETIPNVHVAIRTTGGECVVCRMKTDSVHRIDMLHVVLLDSVTFERILFLLGFRHCIEILDGNSAFYATQHVTLEHDKNKRIKYIKYIHIRYCMNSLTISMKNIKTTICSFAELYASLFFFQKSFCISIIIRTYEIHITDKTVLKSDITKST